MPFRKAKHLGVRKSVVKKPMRKKKHSVVHPRSNLVPAKMDLIMEWQSPFTVTNNSATASNELQVVLNNVYQTYNDVPGTTWTGQKQVSAQFMDQMQALYDEYCVYRADVEIIIANQDTVPIMYAITTANTADAVTTAMLASNVASRPYAVSGVLTAASGSKSIGKFKRTYWMHKLNGVASLKEYIEDTGNENATNTSNTTNSQFLTICFSKLGADSVPTTATILGDIRVKYYVRWFDKQPIVDQPTLG